MGANPEIVGQLVRYVGAQYPDLAGCEGYVRWASANDRRYCVDWHGKFGLIENKRHVEVGYHDMKVIKKYTKGIRS